MPPSVWGQGHAVSWAAPSSWDSRAALGPARLTGTAHSTHPGDHSKEFQMEVGKLLQGVFHKGSRNDGHAMLTVLAPAALAT